MLYNYTKCVVDSNGEKVRVVVKWRRQAAASTTQEASQPPSHTLELC